VEFIKKKILSKTDRKEILVLWNNEYPEKLNFQSLSAYEAYLKELSSQSHILMLDKHQKIKGWYFDCIREHEKWFALIIDSALHQQGIGTKMLAMAKEKAHELNAWVIDHNKSKKKNGQTYHSPLNFYFKNGFKKLTADRLETENISAVKIKWSKQDKSDDQK
jgi:GNAT superfamily N-acetyltransferase